MEHQARAQNKQMNIKEKNKSEDLQKKIQINPQQSKESVNSQNIDNEPITLQKKKRVNQSAKAEGDISSTTVDQIKENKTQEKGKKQRNVQSSKTEEKEQKSYNIEHGGKRQALVNPQKNEKLSSSNDNAERVILQSIKKRENLKKEGKKHLLKENEQESYQSQVELENPERKEQHSHSLTKNYSYPWEGGEVEIGVIGHKNSEDTRELLNNPKALEQIKGFLTDHGIIKPPDQQKKSDIKQEPFFHTESELLSYESLRNKMIKANMKLRGMAANLRRTGLEIQDTSKSVGQLLKNLQTLLKGIGPIHKNAHPHGCLCSRPEDERAKIVDVVRKIDRYSVHTLFLTQNFEYLKIYFTTVLNIVEQIVIAFVKRMKEIDTMLNEQKDIPKRPIS